MKLYPNICRVVNLRISQIRNLIKHHSLSRRKCDAGRKEGENISDNFYEYFGFQVRKLREIIIYKIDCPSCLGLRIIDHLQNRDVLKTMALRTISRA